MGRNREERGTISPRLSRGPIEWPICVAGDDFDLQKQTENSSNRERERARDRQRERMNAKERGNTLLMTLLCAEEGLLAGGLWRRL